MRSGSVALEFVKLLCHVLALDTACADEVTTLRANSMRLLHVPSFSANAQFVNPCRSFVLPDVICAFCSSVRDLDLLRDASLLGHNWTCRYCKHAHSRSRIEARLVDLAQRRSMSYQLQDLRCAKCRLVKADNLSDICANCSGSFMCTESPQSFESALATFDQVARFHRFEFLQQVVDFLRNPI
jgi:DNA polymerase epsilon subunit 1